MKMLKKMKKIYYFYFYLFVKVEIVFSKEVKNKTKIIYANFK